MADQQYLQKRRNSWYVVVEVPKHLRSVLGKPRFLRSLRTDSLSQAQERKHRYVAEFKALIAEAERTKVDPGHRLMFRARELRAELERADDAPVLGPEGKPVPRSELIKALIIDEASEIKDFDGELKADQFYAVAMGEDELVRDAFDRWTRERDGCTEGTEFQRRSVLDDFLHWAGPRTTVRQVTRRRVGTYIERHLFGTKKLTRKTVARYLSAMSPFWRWLEGRGYAVENPWRGQELNLGTSAGAKKPKKEAWPIPSLERLLSGQVDGKHHAVIHDLMRLSLLTGCRLEELCAARKSDFDRREDGWWLRINEGKTDAAAREIPIHPSLETIIVRRLEDPTDAYLFPGLNAGGHDGKRSYAISKAFGRYTRKLGVWTEKHDFHSFRRSFAELAFASGLPEQVVSVLMGHKLMGMSFGVYARGNLLDRRQAILSLVIPPEIQGLIGKEMGEGPRPPRVIARKRRIVQLKPRRRLPDAAE